MRDGCLCRPNGSGVTRFEESANGAGDRAAFAVGLAAQALGDLLGHVGADEDEFGRLGLAFGAVGWCFFAHGVDGSWLALRMEVRPDLPRPAGRLAGMPGGVRRPRARLQLGRRCRSSCR